MFLFIGGFSMNKRKIITVASLVASLVVAAAGAYAYFNGHTLLKANNFNIVAGERDIMKGEIVEPNWDPANAVNLAPTMTVQKDPRLKSGVDYDSYAFMKVTVPKAEGSLNLEDDFELLDALSFTPNNDWVHIADANANSNPGSSRIYLYMYGTDRNNPTVLEAGGTTTPLFNEVRVPDFVRVHAMSGSLDVEGFTEQSTGVSLSTAIADALEWAGISE